MARPGPWSVKGIDEETRAVAREAAERAGLPIGVWIDCAILKATGLIAGTATMAGTSLPPDSTTRVPPSSARLEEVPEMADSADTATEAPAEAAATTQRPVASPLDAPPPADERTPRPILSQQPHQTNEVLRYGLGGAAALAVIVIGITFFDRLAFSPPPVGTPATETAGTPPPPAPPQAARDPAAATVPPSAPAPPPAEGVASNATTAPAPSDSPAGSEIERLTATAAKGDTAAQFDLGMRYSTGTGVAADDRRAAEWLEKAAAQGLPAAQYNLGVLYEEGRGVARDPKLAFFWYQSAAEQGYARAQHNLGTLYATGNGIPQNYDQAAHWFARAADAGVAASMYSLGLMHEHGLGLARDLAKARVHYERAVNAGNPDARAKLAALGPPPPGQMASPPESPAIDNTNRAMAAAPAAGGEAASSAPGSAQALNRRETAELQRLLARLDFAPGAADGVAGRRTTAAIRLYQEFAGLSVDGKPTRGLLEDLRQVAGTLGRRPSNPRR